MSTNRWAGAECSEVAGDPRSAMRSGRIHGGGTRGLHRVFRHRQFLSAGRVAWITEDRNARTPKDGSPVPNMHARRLTNARRGSRSGSPRAPEDGAWGYALVCGPAPRLCIPAVACNRSVRGDGSMRTHPERPYWHRFRPHRPIGLVIPGAVELAGGAAVEVEEEEHLGDRRDANGLLQRHARLRAHPLALRLQCPRRQRGLRLSSARPRWAAGRVDATAAGGVTSRGPARDEGAAHGIVQPFTPDDVGMGLHTWFRKAALRGEPRTAMPCSWHGGPRHRCSVSRCGDKTVDLHPHRGTLQLLSGNRLGAGIIPKESPGEEDEEEDEVNGKPEDAIHGGGARSLRSDARFLQQLVRKRDAGSRGCCGSACCLNLCGGAHGFDALLDARRQCGCCDTPISCSFCDNNYIAVDRDGDLVNARRRCGRSGCHSRLTLCVNTYIPDDVDVHGAMRCGNSAYNTLRRSNARRPHRGRGRERMERSGTRGDGMRGRESRPAQGTDRHHLQGTFRDELVGTCHAIVSHVCTHSVYTFHVPSASTILTREADGNGNITQPHPQPTPPTRAPVRQPPPRAEAEGYGERRGAVAPLPAHRGGLAGASIWRQRNRGCAVGGQSSHHASPKWCSPYSPAAAAVQRQRTDMDDTRGVDEGECVDINGTDDGRIGNLGSKDRLDGWMRSANRDFDSPLWTPWDRHVSWMDVTGKGDVDSTHGSN